MLQNVSTNMHKSLPSDRSPVRSGNITEKFDVYEIF